MNAKSGRREAITGDTRPRPGASKSAPAAAHALAPALYVVATPIGNLSDLSARAIETLARVALIACEDTRVSGVLLARHGISTPTAAYHDHNAERMRPKLLARLRAGEAVALISDAGTPLISDPGYKLVRACIEAGVAVVPVPGPSAVMAALTAAGLPTDRFLFAGFLPPKSAARRAALAELRDVKATLVMFEAANRCAEALADMAVVLGDRPAALCRELTKLHEQVRRGPVSQLAQGAADDPPRGEVVIVVAGAGDHAPAVDLDALLTDALSAERLRDAVDAVAAATGRPRREVYARALELKAARDGR
ncbi:MAG: 16S rRNA (cytidine(1402)-2'-O)-methyltransferase [Rhodospirillaceae bacterium]|nr:16S rRNA (cytidine(1402)-2'-O)-methyltransferase [Rhodospirillaceae bacterium]